MADLFGKSDGTDGLRVRRVRLPVAERARARVRDDGASQRVAKHRSKNVALYRQGDINFVVNQRAGRALAAYFAAEHGPSACGMAFRVKDSHKAYAASARAAARSRWTMPTRSDGIAPACDQGHRRRAAVPDRPLRATASRSTTSTSSSSTGVDRHPRGSRPQAHRSPDAQRLPRPHGVLGRASTSGSSTSARSATSTSRANTRASRRAR